MRQEVRNFSEILNTPGIWIELYLDRNTGIWEISGAKYFVTQNKKIVCLELLLYVKFLRKH